jgi:hypothetical protein
MSRKQRLCHGRVVSLLLKLTFFVPADGWPLVAGSPVQNCEGPEIAGDFGSARRDGEAARVHP